MGQFEDALVRLEVALAEASRSSAAAASALKRLRRAAADGNVKDIEQSLAAVAERARGLTEASDRLSRSWQFEASAYLGAGYVAELVEAAAAQGVDLFERDQRVYAFPVILRVEPQELGVRVSGKRQRKLRPSALAKELKTLQQKTPRQPPQVLALLFKVYRALVRDEWQRLADGAGGPLVPLGELHAMLITGPGADYPIEEFGRDIHVLAQHPELRTADGAIYRLGSDRIKPRIAVWDRDGREHIYSWVQFLKG